MMVDNDAILVSWDGPGGWWWGVGGPKSLMNDKWLIPNNGWPNSSIILKSYLAIDEFLNQSAIFNHFGWIFCLRSFLKNYWALCLVSILCNWSYLMIDHDWSSMIDQDQLPSSWFNKIINDGEKHGGECDGLMMLNEWCL